MSPILFAAIRDRVVYKEASIILARVVVMPRDSAVDLPRLSQADMMIWRARALVVYYRYT